MQKAQPWNINGVGFDAREAAREAARRQGKSLGEWLHGVIADHAEDHGLAPRAIGGQERIDAVTARLEQLGARPGVDHARRDVRARPDPRMPLQRAPKERDPAKFDDEDAVVPRVTDGSDRRAQRAALARDEHDDLLESAVTAMERRAVRTERRTDQALASMAKLLEETEARREQEYGDVAALTRKLGKLESTLSQRFAAVAENPIKGSLARLEARLDAIGRRGAAEMAARDSAVVDRIPDAIEPIRRLEDKLNTILEAVQSGASGSLRASSVAMAAVQAAQHDPVSPHDQAMSLPGRRSLGDAIADISRRQRVLEEPANEDRPAPRQAVKVERPDATEAMVASLRGEMASLAVKVDDIRREALLMRQARPAARDGELDALRADLGAIARTLGGLAPRGSIDALETSIATLAERIEVSREHGIRESILRPVEAAVGDLRLSLHRLDPRETIGGLEEELRRIGDKLDASGHDGVGIDRLQQQMEELRETVVTMAARPLPIERIEHQVAVLAERLDRRLDQPFAGPDVQAEIAAATDALRAMIGGAPAHLEKIETRLDLLAGRLDQALSADRPPMPMSTDTRQLEHLVRELGLRFEAAQAPGADHGALDSLQRQVEHLSERFERSETGLSALPTLAASMRELFSHLEATRASVESSAAKAAREVLKIAVDEGQQHRETVQEPAFRALQDEVEARTSSTLNTVQDMLGKVVDRLSVMEHEISDVRQRPAASEPTVREAPAPAPHQTRPRASITRPVIGESPREIRLGGMEPRPGSAPTKPPRKAEATIADSARRSDFIAAARRAAATAQAEASAAQRQSPSDKAARAGLLARSRDYVAAHKRPVLMGVAALMMGLGVIALMDRTGGFGGGVQLASAPATSGRTAVAAPAASTRIATASGLDAGALSPSVLPKTAAPLANPIPGSDPIQTGSIPSLPSFAAGAAPPPPQRPMLSPALVAAAEGGDIAAQYDLANRYAEGRIVPRDMKLAANWFEKAADAGSAPAQYRLASLYEKGIGVVVDKTKARSLYIKAADAGNPRAMHNLAVLLADGDGHPDYAGAVGWFRKAAQYGIHDSQYNLAVLLARGLGAPQSLVQSYQWFSVAAVAGDADAEKKRDEVGLKLSANDFAVAKALAAAFQPRVPDPAAVEVTPPPGGWDGAAGASRLNSARSKISSL